ncbi:MAG: hypothetical protein AAF192_04130 [Pseudomonadota bacterium]
MTRLVSAALVLAPAAALAHAGPEGHAHPHGVEAALLALAALAVAGLWLRARR